MVRPCRWPPLGRRGVVIGARKRKPSAPPLSLRLCECFLFRGLPWLTSYVIEYARDPLSWRVLFFLPRHALRCAGFPDPVSGSIFSRRPFHRALGVKAR
jgi:hypothetical protein